MPDTIIRNPMDGVALRLREMLALQQIADEQETIDNGPLYQAYRAAMDRFIEEPARSPSDMLLKLEMAHECEDLEGMLQKEPNLALPRIILNLIRDLRSVPGVSGQVQ